MNGKPIATRIMDLWEEGVMVGGVVFISGLLFANVIGRQIGHSIIPAEELAFIAMLIITFFGLSYVTRKGRHIRVGVLLDLSGFKIKKVMVFFEAILGGLLMCLFAYLSVIYTIQLVTMERSTVSLNWPYWIFSIWLIFGFTLSAFHYIRLVTRNIKEKKEVWLSPEEKGGYI